MRARAKKRWMVFGLIVVIIGGLVHVFQPLGFNILNLFGGASGIVQFIAGGISIWSAILGLRKTK